MNENHNQAKSNEWHIQQSGQLCFLIFSSNSPMRSIQFKRTTTCSVSAGPPAVLLTQTPHHTASDKRKAAFNVSHVGLQRHGALCVVCKTRLWKRCEAEVYVSFLTLLLHLLRRHSHSRLVQRLHGHERWCSPLWLHHLQHSSLWTVLQQLLAGALSKLLPYFL